MATFVQDSFTEGSNLTLSSHTPDVGGTWVSIGGSTAQVNGAGDYCQGNSSGTTAVYYNSASPADNNIDVSAVMATTPTSLTRQAVMAINDTNASLNGYSLRRELTGGNDFVLTKHVGGTPTNLAAGVLGMGKSTLQLKPAGSVKIRALLDDVSQYTNNDTTFSTFAHVGLWGRAADQIDDFLATDGNGDGAAFVGNPWYYYAQQ